MLNIRNNPPLKALRKLKKHLYFIYILLLNSLKLTKGPSIGDPDPHLIAAQP